MVRLSNLLILFVFAFVMVAGPHAADAKARKKQASSENDKYASIVVDAQTGAILSQANPDKVLHPASLTKMMTLMLTFEALEKGALRPTDRIVVSKRAASMSPTKLGLAPGQTIRVQDAIYAVVTKSANDIAVALAEAVGGSEANFVQLMNMRANAIGMNRTRFKNASGLPNPAQVSTARDMAKLARYIITQHAAYYPVFNKRDFVFNGKTYHNHNRLMDTYAGMDGMKTGYVNASGFNLVASAKRNNQRLVAVVFGGKTTASRNLHMAGLLDKGFEQMSQVRMASAAKTRHAPTPIQNTMAPNTVALATAANSITPAAASSSDAPMIVDTAAPEQTAVVQETVSFKGNTLTDADRLMETAPQVSSFAQTRNTAHAIERNAAPAVRMASLSTANDSQPVTATAPLYQPQQATAPTPQYQNAAVQPQPSGYATSGTWAIQVGAFQSRVATDQALYNAIHTLPANLGSVAKAMIVPMRTADATWVFRARLSGFDQAQAQQACAALKDCLTISPQAY